VSALKTRSFTVPKGRTFATVPPDGDGPVVAHEGETVLIIVARSYEKAVGEALRRLNEADGE
jgi:hypothetical protein